MKTNSTGSTMTTTKPSDLFEGENSTIAQAFKDATEQDKDITTVNTTTQDWEAEFNEKYSLKEVFEGRYLQQALLVSDILSFIRQVVEEVKAEELEKAIEIIRDNITPEENVFVESEESKLVRTYANFRFETAIQSLQLQKEEL